VERITSKDLGSRETYSFNSLLTHVLLVDEIFEKDLDLIKHCL